jgi:hypothetical protein
MPAKAGIQNYLKIQDSRLRGNDAKGGFKIFYETIKYCILSILKKAEQSDSTLRNSAVRYSIFCGSLFNSHVVSCKGFISFSNLELDSICPGKVRPKNQNMNSRGVHWGRDLSYALETVFLVTYAPARANGRKLFLATIG